MPLKDEIFEGARKNHLMTVGFLKSLKEQLPAEHAYRLAAKGFANFMIENYSLIFEGTSPGSQDRFDRLRKNYEDSAVGRPYLKIVRSDQGILQVRYDRCPFCEVMKKYGLEEFSTAFCLSDQAFTSKLLPGVDLIRDNEIGRGAPFCETKWIFNKGADI